VSGEVVKRNIADLYENSQQLRQWERPIQCAACLTFSGQSKQSRSSSKRRSYAVMRHHPLRMPFREDREIAAHHCGRRTVTSSLARTVPGRAPVATRVGPATPVDYKVDRVVPRSSADKSDHARRSRESLHLTRSRRPVRDGPRLCSTPGRTTRVRSAEGSNASTG